MEKLYYIIKVSICIIIVVTLHILIKLVDVLSKNKGSEIGPLNRIVQSSVTHALDRQFNPLS